MTGYGAAPVTRLLPLLLLSGCGPGTVYVAMAAQNNSGQSGMAELRNVGGGLQVVVEVKAIPGVPSQLAHLHPGRCSEMGLPFRRVSGSGPCGAGVEGCVSTALEAVVADGDTASSKTLLDGVKLQSFSGGGWCINVHHPEDSQLYTSCGNID